MKDRDKLLKAAQRHMRFSSRECTLMMTDMEGSVQQWEMLGDIHGRMMVDYHNRLLFPIIKKYRGKVVKTMGDAIMATFRHPANALKAAIAIQQRLRTEREGNPDFPRVRIALHTGKAILEKGDIFGDMVNVTARIEGKARGSQILISGRAVKRLKSQKPFFLERKLRFTPKGKSTPMTLYQCDWTQARDLTVSPRGRSSLLGPSQRWKIFGAGVVGLLMFAFLFLRYIRFLLLDSESLSLTLLNPRLMISHYPWVGALVLLSAVFFIVLIVKLNRLPFVLFRLALGGFIGCAAFFLFYIPTQVFDLNPGFNSQEVLYRSEHLFVQVVAAEASVHSAPDNASELLRTAGRGTLFLLSDTVQVRPLVWNKVLVGRSQFGYVKRVEPPRIGVPEQRMTRAGVFEFKWLDVYTLIAGLIGFLAGLFRFRIRPA